MNPSSIFVEETPNPETLRFSTGFTILIGDPFEVRSGSFVSSHPSALIESSLDHNSLPTLPSPLCKKVLSLQGIESIFIASEFFSITKSSLYSWDIMLPQLMAILEQHFATHPSPEHNTTSSPANTLDTSEISERIEDVLETFVRPHVGADGGDVTLHAFDKGIAFLRLQGACSGCPSSQATLKGGIERVLTMMIPEVIGVEAVDDTVLAALSGKLEKPDEA